MLLTVMDEDGKGDAWIASLTDDQRMELLAAVQEPVLITDDDITLDVLGDWIEDHGGDREWASMMCVLQVRSERRNPEKVA